MTGAPSSSSFVMVDPLHVSEVGPAAAVLFGRITWRSQATGSWRAPKAVLAAETGLTPAMIRTASQVLRDLGWVTAVRASDDDATLVWAPVCAGQPDSAESAPPPCDIRTTPPAESALSSIETVDRPSPPTVPPVVVPSADADDQGTLPLLTLVSDAPDYEAEFARFWDLWPSGRKVGKPKALQAYTRARRRGATIEAIAAGLHAHLPAWTARVAAGEAGFIPHPTTWLNRDGWDDPPPAPARGRRMSNAFADPSLGGPTPGDMARFSAMMNADRPLALGGGA